MSTTEVALPSTSRADVTQATAIASARAVAEVEAMVIVAQRMPRDMTRARAEIKAECSRMAMAQKAFYSVPNRGKGTTVHLAREMARIVGNIEYGVHELRRDDLAGMSEIQAYAWDLQTNTRSTRTFQVPHQKMVGKTRTNLVDLGDVYLNNQNIGARAVRECINTVLPTSLVEDAADWCRNTLEHGEGKPIEERRDAMVAVFSRIGVTVEMLEARLGRKRSQWEPGDLADASVVFKSIERGELSKDEAFPPMTVSEADLPPAPTAAVAPAPTPEPVKPVEPPVQQQRPTQQQQAQRAQTGQRRPPVTHTPPDAGSEYGVVGPINDAGPPPRATPPPDEPSADEAMTGPEFILYLAAQHGVESGDGVALLCSQTIGREVVSPKDLNAAETSRVITELQGLAEGVDFPFATATDNAPPVTAGSGSPNDWSGDDWRTYLNRLNVVPPMKVTTVLPPARQIMKDRGIEGTIGGIDDIAGKGIGEDLMGWVEDQIAAPVAT